MQTFPAVPLAALREARNNANPLVRKLSHFIGLSLVEQRLIEELTSTDEVVAADVDISVEGVAPRGVFMLREGMAVRYRTLPNGGRQIMTFLIPGDLCDVHVFLLQQADHSIGTVIPSRIAAIPRDRVMQITARYPRIGASFLWSAQQEESMLRERIVSLGRRDARGRIAHLLCELLWRYSAIGRTPDEMFRLPLTQTELADTLGLTPVHVNRVLKEFRGSRLIAMENRTLRLLDINGLQEMAGFDSSYLHLNGASMELTRYLAGLEASAS